MDETHREFVDLLAQAVQADDARLLPAWNALIDHTQDHFDREDRWMTDTRFSSSNCHTTQHKVVLAVMREGGRRGAAAAGSLTRRTTCTCWPCPPAPASASGWTRSTTSSTHPTAPR